MGDIIIHNSKLSNSPVINVSSERKDRHINDDIMEQIIQKIPKGKKIIFGIMPGSKPETINLANEIKNNLIAVGENVGDITMVGNFPIFEGDISFKNYGDILFIII